MSTEDRKNVLSFPSRGPGADLDKRMNAWAERLNTLRTQFIAMQPPQLAAEGEDVLKRMDAIREEIATYRRTLYDGIAMPCMFARQSYKKEYKTQGRALDALDRVIYQSLEYFEVIYERERRNTLPTQK